MSSQRTYWIDNADDARWYHSQPERADLDHPGVVAETDEPLTGEWLAAWDASRAELAAIAGGVR